MARQSRASITIYDVQDGTNGTNVSAVENADGSVTISDDAGAVGTIFSATNTATVRIFIRSSSAPTTFPTASATFTFDGFALAFNSGDPSVSNGWSVTHPEGTDTIWSRAVAVGSTFDTVTIAADDWGPTFTLGSEGSDGASAYEIAVSQGFVGTETQWVNSLQGVDAPRSTQRDVYFGPSENNPGNPDAGSINFTNGSIFGLTPNWSLQPPLVSTTGTNDVYWQSTLTFTETAFGSTQSVSSTFPTPLQVYGTDIQSDNFVAGESGWRIERQTGNAEFDDAIIRGNSVVESSSIGGEAFISWNQISTDSTLGGVLSGGLFSGAGLSSLSTPTEFVRFAVENVGDYLFSDGSIFLAGRLTSGVDATSLSQFSGFPLNLTLTFEYLDVNGSSISTQSQSFQLQSSDFSYSSSGYITEVILSSVLNDLIVPSQTTEISLKASWSGPSNWGPSFISIVNLTAGTSIEKPSSASAYIVSSDGDKYAAEIEGGLGLRIHSQLLFEGSETSIGNFGSSSGADESFMVLVDWDDSEDTDSFISYNRASILASSTSEEEFDAVGRNATIRTVVLANIFSSGDTSTTGGITGGKYIGSLTYNGATLSLRTDNSHSTISNQRIRKVWSKFK